MKLLQISQTAIVRFSPIKGPKFLKFDSDLEFINQVKDFV